MQKVLTCTRMHTERHTREYETHTYPHIHTHETHAYPHIHKHTQTYLYTCTYTYVRMCTYTYTYVRMCTYTYTYSLSLTHVFVPNTVNVFMCLGACVYDCVHVYLFALCIRVYHNLDAHFQKLYRDIFASRKKQRQQNWWPLYPQVSLSVSLSLSPLCV